MLLCIQYLLWYVFEKRFIVEIFKEAKRKKRVTDKPIKFVEPNGFEFPSLRLLCVVCRVCSVRPCVQLLLHSNPINLFSKYCVE